MKKLSRKHILLGSVLLLFFGTAPVLACMCPYARGPVADQVKWAREGSTTVFSGKVVGVEYRKGILYDTAGRPTEENPEDRETKLVRIQVDRWWKMALPDEIFLITDQWRLIEGPVESPPSGNVLSLPLRSRTLIGCGIPFVMNQTYLVYAHGDADRLQFRACSRTTFIERAGDDLPILGPGKKPKKSKKLQ
jgi:hypothetical protein